MNPEMFYNADAGGIAGNSKYIISTTIKKIWLDKILSGEKSIEFKIASNHWNKRLLRLTDPRWTRPIEINFLCGRDSYRFRVESVEIIIDPDGFDIDGEITNEYYAIHLGKRIFPKVWK